MRLRTNTLALFISFFGTAVLAVIQFKLISLFMDQEAVGLWSVLFASGAMLGTLSELGLPVVLLRFGARFDAVDNPGRYKRLLRFAWVTLGMAYMTMAAILLLGGESLGTWVSGEPVSRGLMLLVYAALASGSIRALNNAAFKSFRKMIWIPVLEILFAILMTSSIFLLRDSLSVHLLFLVFLAASLLVGVLGSAVLWVKLRHKSGEDRDPSHSILSEVKMYWMGAALSGIFVIAMERLDKVVVVALFTLQAAAIYEGATRLAMFAKRMLGQPAQVLLPEITHKWETGRGAELLEDMRLFIKLQLVLGLMLSLPLIVFAYPIIRTVSTPEYLSGAPALWAFCLSVPILCLYHPMITMLKATGHIWPAFASEALWVLLYLGVGALLSTRWGIGGLASGQVVASLCMLLYTLLVYYRMRLPRPGWAFFLRLSVFIAVLWLPARLAAGRVGPELSIWVAGAGTLVIGVVLNLILVWGGFVSASEQQRVIDLLAGKGALGKLVRFGFNWPRALAPWIGVVMIVLSAGWVNGCAKGLEHGCTCNDDVPKHIREEILAATDVLFDRIKAEDAEAIFEAAASPVKEKSNAYEFVKPMAEAVGRFGFPEERQVQKLQAIHFKRGHAIEFPVPCQCGDEELDKLMLRRHPTQASLILLSNFGPITVQYSVLYWLEDEEWRVGGFVARPANLYGRDWKDYEDWADRQMAKGNLRNAALLMNVALDLLVPNSWTRPESVDEIETKQNSLMVTNLPANMLDIWETPDRDYRVYKVEKLYGPEALDLGVHYETYESLADTALINIMHRKLFEYIQVEFPEYADVFAHAVIRATEAGAIHSTGHTQVYPLKEEE